MIKTRYLHYLRMHSSPRIKQIVLLSTQKVRSKVLLLLPREQRKIVEMQQKKLIFDHQSFS